MIVPSHTAAEASLIAARALVEVEAVAIRPDEPFTYTSGLKSPVYVDCRKLIAFPRLRSVLMDLAVETVFREAGLEAFDAVAGGETAGIPFAAWIAERMMLPMLYVRKKPKGFGRNAQIEGEFQEGQRILLVEDLATDGGTKLKFATALREAGAVVDHSFVVFHHDIFPGSQARMAEHGLNLHTLARWRDVLTVAAERFPPEALEEVERFLAAPLAWSAARGGIDEIAPGT